MRYVKAKGTGRACVLVKAGGSIHLREVANKGREPREANGVKEKGKGKMARVREAKF